MSYRQFCVVCATLFWILMCTRAQAQGTWTLYTAEGSREEPVPEFRMIEVGEGEIIDYGEGVVTGTGQGTIISVDEEVIPGPGGTPVLGPVIDGGGQPPIAEDKEGNLWFVALGKHVVNKFDGIGWTVYGVEDGLAERVGGVAVGQEGNVWFSGNRSVSRFDGTHWTRYDIWASSIVVAPNGDLWFADGYGYRFDGANWWKYTDQDGLVYNEASAVAADSAGAVWFGMHTNTLQYAKKCGVTKFDGATWISYGYPYNGGEEPYLNGMWWLAALPDGNLWAGTGGGLLCFDGASWRLYADPIPEDPTGSPRLDVVLQGAMDASGALWLATGEGLTIKTGLTWPTLLYDNVGWWGEGVFFDASGRLWIQTPQGIISWAVPTAVLTADNSGEVPASFQLFQNSPNPFNASTQIGFSLKESGEVTLKVLDIVGQSVDLLVSRMLPVGNYRARWDGRDQAGRPVGSGLYFVRLETAESALTKRMIFLR